jgi:hypothetical protein
MDLLEVIFQWLGSSLQIMFNCCHELLARVVDFLPDVAVAGHCIEAMRSACLPLFLALSSLSGAFNGGARPASAGSPLYHMGCQDARMHLGIF